MEQSRANKTFPILFGREYPLFPPSKLSQIRKIETHARKNPFLLETRNVTIKKYERIQPLSFGEKGEGGEISLVPPPNISCAKPYALI